VCGLKEGYLGVFSLVLLFVCLFLMDITELLMKILLLLGEHF
jgi:hypothetical protein